MSRKTFIRGAAVAAAVTMSAAALTGCSANVSSPSSSGGAVTFAYPKAGAVNVWEDLAKQYKKKTGKTVTVQAIPIDAYSSSLNTRLQGGDAPDLFLTKPGTTEYGITTLGKSKLLGPITGAAAKLVNSSEKDAYEVGGTTYGFPLYNVPRATVVIDGNLQKSGITWPTTVSEMLSDCKATQKKGEAFTLGQFGAPFTADGQTLLVAASSVYAKDPNWDKERAAGSVKFSTTPGWKYAVQTMADMIKANCYQSGAVAAKGELFQSIFAGKNPNVISFATGESDVWKDFTVSLKGQTLSVRPFPGQSADTQRVMNAVKFTLSYSAATKNKAGVQDYIDWLIKPAQQKTIADELGGVPAGPVTADEMTGSFAPLKQLVSEGKVVNVPGQTWPATVLAALQQDGPGLFTGQKTVDQILADMDAAWK